MYPSVCLNMHTDDVCSFPCACSDRQTDRNINTHVLTDRQTDRQYILASVYTKTRQQIKMLLLENECCVVALCQTC